MAALLFCCYYVMLGIISIIKLCFRPGNLLLVNRKDDFLSVSQPNGATLG
jgi:hypothetical protein